jgi:VWFA-related protein
MMRMSKEQIVEKQIVKGKTQKANHLQIAWLIGLILFMSFGFLVARAQTQENKDVQKTQDEVITLKARLVNLDVMVKDKKGKFITDLKAEDFTLFENGVQQKVEFFDPPLSGVTQPTSVPTASQPKTVPTGSSTGNILSLVIDGQTTELANLKQVREGTIKYIRERISDTDAVAVFGISNDLNLLQSFTQDKAKLIAAVEKAYTLTASNKSLERNATGEQIAQLRDELNGSAGVNLPQSPAAATQGSAAARTLIASRVLEQYVKLRAQLNLQQARPILAALAALCEAQRAIPGKKTVVLFSQGFTTSSILDWQIQSTIDMANRANVAIYIIDSTGLTGGGPQSGAFVSSGALGGIAATGSPDARSKAVGGESLFDNTRYEGLNREQDILYRISGDTGGEFLKGNNDIGKGLEKIDQEIRARYTLAYYSTDANLDGSFRKVKVEVRRPESHAVTRAGYYAIANDEIVPLSVDDKKLLARLAEGENNPDLPLFLEMSPFRSAEGRYIVPLSLEVPSSAVKFDRKGDKQQLQLDVLGVIREPSDKIVSRLGGVFNVGLAPEQYQSIVNNNIFYRQDMELIPGTYRIDLIVRDRLSGKISARKAQLVLPNTEAEYSTSAVVLSRLALPSNNQPGAKPSTDIFNQGGIQIRPSASREFRVTDNLIVFFELYHAALNAETKKPMVRVTLTVWQDGKMIVKPIDYVLTEPQPAPVEHLIFAKYLKLAGLSPGKYTVKIEARDMVTRKLLTKEADMVITQ